LDTQVGFKVVDRRRFAGVGHTLYGLIDNTDDQAITKLTNRYRVRFGRDIADPLGEATRGKERFGLGFPIVILVPAP
jgi:hypothetical protein